MRRNKYGVRGLKGVNLPRGFVYFWVPPRPLSKAGAFRFVTLGTDLGSALRQAIDWNQRVEDHLLKVRGPKLLLGPIAPRTVGSLVREFENSPKFKGYSLRTRRDYSNIYRRAEVEAFGLDQMLGHLKLNDVTKQLAYTLYEQYLAHSGAASANKVTSAWHAVFKYATLKIPGVTSNPFAQLGRQTPPPRRQRWTDEQLEAFISKADQMGYSSIGFCALMCMELVQRPGDILNLTWDAYQEDKGAWIINQSKCGVELYAPPTRRLSAAMGLARRGAQARARGDVGRLLVCPTATGKRWHRRNFARTVRLIAEAAGLPDHLQIRDLRRTAATEAACSGATAAELMAIGGWQNPASVSPYLVGTLDEATACQSKREAYRRRRRVS